MITIVHGFYKDRQNHTPGYTPVYKLAVYKNDQLVYSGNNPSTDHFAMIGALDSGNFQHMACRNMTVERFPHTLSELKKRFSKQIKLLIVPRKLETKT